ncbi:MAG: tetratricopeptide repeat protein [Clostridia bacterium]|nr:tetratricopeptide repeat protein [Clostridia bacterium]
MSSISKDRILSKLDEYLHKNDYNSAERHLVYWLAEAINEGDTRAELLVRNELMGLYRKLGKEDEALACVSAALAKIEASGIAHQVGAATTYLNAATVYKAFGKADKALPLFETAKEVYERELDAGDDRLAGLYNNMALALVDVGRFKEARALYQQAIAILEQSQTGDLEIAITYLNLASLAESELGLEDAAELIDGYAKKAESLLEAHTPQDGYYAFVCEKCASVFGYYGYFYYAKELTERSRRIYRA